MTSSDLSTKLLHVLAEPAARALVLAALAGMALALARARDAAARLAVWTAVLYVSLAMPFLARLAPALSLPIPALPTIRAFPPARVAIRDAVPGSNVQVAGAASLIARSPVKTALRQPQGPRQRRAQWTISWPFIAVTLYLLVAAALLGRLTVGLYFSRRLMLLSTPIRDGAGLRFLIEQSRRWALREAPGLAESRAVAVPVTLGWWRPVILLPLAWRGWSEGKTQAVLAHELSHVVRKDARTRALAALHRSVFWFSPLAWWLERHLAALAEQASDDAALGAGTDRVFYAEVLLGFFKDLQNAMGRVRWEGVAMTRGKQAHERVDRILDSTRKLSVGLRKPVWALVALLGVPVVLLLAGARPVVAQKSQREDAHTAVMTNAVGAAGWQAQPADSQSPSAPTAPKLAPGAPPAPKAPSAPASTSGQRADEDTGDTWVMTFGEYLSPHGATQRSEVERVRALRRVSNADFVWFRRNGKAYIVRDPATVHRAQDLYAPARLLEQTKENLEAKQEAFIAQQEKLHKQLDQVRVDVPDLTAQLTKLQAQLDQLHKNGATLDQLNELQNALKRLQGTLSELQGEAGGKLGGIGGEQGALGGRMVEVGDQLREMLVVQAQMERENCREMKELLDGALAKGFAQPE